MCALDRDICLRDSTRREGNRKIKDVGCGRHKSKSWVGRYEKIFLRVILKEQEQVCLFNVGVGSR